MNTTTTTLRGLTQQQVDALNQLSHHDNFIVAALVFTAFMVLVTFLMVTYLVDRRQ